MSTSLAAKVEFRTLCNILEDIVKARSSAKADILEKFIQHCRVISDKIKQEYPDTDASLFPVLRLILPSLERERGAQNLKEKSLANLYIRVFCLGKDSKNANKLINYKAPVSKKVVGCDFAEKAFSILQNRLPRESSRLTVQRINSFLDDISSRNNTPRQRDEMFKILFGKISALEFKWITRIILKDLRLGIGTKRILQVFHRDANALFDVTSNLHQVCDTLFDPELRYNHGIKVFSHFKPMLLERCRIEDIQKLFNKGEEFFVQSKYDGERSQMHMKDGKFKYFTRQGYDITHNSSYGETASSGFMSSVFGRLLNADVKSVILDGELMGWHKDKKMFGSKGMSFDVKKLSENSRHQPCFVAFDVLMYNDVLLHNETCEKRLNILKSLFKEEEGSLLFCKSTKISTIEELREAFNESMKNKEEGIVVKKYDSIYKPNVRDGYGCYKIKAEYSEDLVQDVDLIIVGGYYGDGKYMGVIKSFLTAVACPPEKSGENPTKFFSVVSVSNGFSMNMLEELREMFDGKWQEECPTNVIPPRLEPPTLWIQPEKSLVLTVRATEISQSKDYPTGYSLRFPRVMNVRTDKPWYTVCTTTELLSLIKDTRPIQKLTKREVDYEDIKDISEIDTHEAKRQRFIKFDERPIECNAFNNPQPYHTRLFDGKEICVINGNEELSKDEVEKILLQHKAKVVQNPLTDNFCVIVGNDKTARAINLIQSAKYDVVTLQWLKRVIKEENWSKLQDFYPWDLICCRESTKRRLAQYYDEYYDHYTKDANEESLSRSIKRIEETGINAELDDVEMKEMDEELYGNDMSPYSLFRCIVGYFNDESDPTKIEFRFMAGTIKHVFDDSVTHVFINNYSIDDKFKEFISNKSQASLTIVKNDWIVECFKQNTIVPHSEYLIK